MLVDGTAVRQARLSRGLYQHELAHESGLSRFTVQGVESGRRERAHVSTVRMLARALDISVDEIATPESDFERHRLEREAADA